MSEINKGTFIEEVRRALREHGLPELDSPKFVDAVERAQSEAILAESAHKALSGLLDKYEQVIEEKP
jgi:hypothetical protein